jgi:hypothetical protein
MQTLENFNLKIKTLNDLKIWKMNFNQSLNNKPDWIFKSLNFYNLKI